MDRSMNESKSARCMWRAILWGTLALVLLIPALAMQVTVELDWTSSDFVIMGVLLAALGLGIEAAMGLSRSRARMGAIAAILLVFMAIWAELAVGIFGTLFAGS